MFENVKTKSDYWGAERRCSACGNSATISLDIRVSREGVRQTGTLTELCNKCDRALTLLIDGFYAKVESKKTAVEVECASTD